MVRKTKCKRKTKCNIIKKISLEYIACCSGYVFIQTSFGEHANGSKDQNRYKKSSHETICLNRRFLGFKGLTG